MKSHDNALAGLGIGLFCLIVVALAQCTPAPPTGRPEQPPAPAAAPPSTADDPSNLLSRVQNRRYLFTDTNENIPYSLFVSSKVTKDKKNPLILALHGLGGGPTSLFGGGALRFAEDGGYILVGPMGYNNSGWYGIPLAGAGRGRGTPAPATQPGATAPRGTTVTDPALVRQLSEKDVMNVLEMMRKEFNVDDRRTYLMGHSMGGAGAIYLGVKYASNWAAIGALAPAGSGLQPAGLAPIKDVPVILVQGDADTSVPVANTRRLADELKSLNVTYVYKEIPGATHGSVIGLGMPEVFAFFAQHTKPETH
jgi:predicted esterase